MDDSRFDALTRGLAAGKSRRSVLRGLIGGGAAVVAAKTGGTLAAPAPKVTICHFTGSASNPYQIISISSNAYAQHVANHGDFKYGNCCLDSECSQLGDQCHTGKCDKGTCVAVPNPGANCDDGNACTVNDVCKPNGICKGTPLDCSEYDDQCNTGECDGGVCITVPNPGVNCDDGNACTVNDVCDEDGTCAGTHASVDCAVSDWGEFGACQGNCGTVGQQCRERTVVTEPSCDGDECPALVECQECDTAACPPVCQHYGSDDAAPQCFWMENQTGTLCWVPATWAGSGEEGCQDQDSCAIDGRGGSGGGCYKWATSSTSTIKPNPNWD